MVSDDKLLDHDTDDGITLVRYTPQEEPPKLFPPPN